MNPFVYTAHLWREDRELFAHDDNAFQMALNRATTDVLRDLDRHGVNTDAVENAFKNATVELSFTAPAMTGLTIPKGTGVTNVDPKRGKYAGVVFKTDFDQLLMLGETAIIPATAVHPGAPANVGAKELAYLAEPDALTIERVTNPEAATGGSDHQMTRAATYRAMELVYLDLMRTIDDAFGSRRRVYGKMYREEVDRSIAAGVRMAAGTLTPASGKTHGTVRFRRS